MPEMRSSIELRARNLAVTYRREIGLCSATDLYNQSFKECYNHNNIILFENTTVVNYFTERPRGKLVLINGEAAIKGSGEASKVLITFSPIEDGSTVLEVRKEVFIDTSVGVEHRSTPIVFLDTTEHNERDDYIFMDLNNNEIGYIGNQIAQNLAVILEFQNETFKPNIRMFKEYLKDVNTCMFAKDVRTFK